MNYDLHIARVPNSELVGIEIQPPISDKASDGICAVLRSTYHGPEAPEPTLAEMTRNDSEGTGLVFGREDGNVSDIQGLARKMGALINPAGLHEVAVHLST